MKKTPLVLILFFSTALYVYCQTADEIAIKRLLEKESETWRTGDIKSHANCWAIKPYSRIIFSSLDGKAIDIPPQTIINPPANIVGKGGTAKLFNFKMSIHANNAWVSHDEESTAQDGTTTYTYEFRMLEKINNEWKIVAQSIHAYQPQK